MARQASTLPRANAGVELDPCTLWLTTHGISVDPTDPLSCSSPKSWALDRRGPQAVSDRSPASWWFDLHFTDDATCLTATCQALNESPGAYLPCEPMQPLLAHFQHTAHVRNPCCIERWPCRHPCAPAPGLSRLCMHHEPGEHAVVPERRCTAVRVSGGNREPLRHNAQGLSPIATE